MPVQRTPTSSIHDFLVEKIRALQMVIKTQDDARSLSQASIAWAQDPSPPQPEVEDECLTPKVLELGNLQLFNPVAQEHDRDEFLQQYTYSITGEQNPVGRNWEQKATIATKPDDRRNWAASEAWPSGIEIRPAGMLCRALHFEREKARALLLARGFFFYFGLFHHYSRNEVGETFF
jgi:hypothetical protein